MTYRYNIKFLTYVDKDLIPNKPIDFPNPIQVGDMIQIDEDGIGEFHLVRLVTHSPVGSTLMLSGKGTDPFELFTDSSNEIPLLELLAAEYERK